MRKQPRPPTDEGGIKAEGGRFKRAFIPLLDSRGSLNAINCREFRRQVAGLVCTNANRSFIEQTGGLTPPARLFTDM
ncbi:MAG: hypothetical protein Tsb009_31350 [Planctomycetaceae bacterium]